MEMQVARSAWAEVDLDRLRHNIQIIINKITPEVKLMAVVKANAYGHGAVEVAKAAIAHGVYAFGVATIAEGIELRQAGIAAPILILGAIDAREVHAVVEYLLTPSVFTLPVARALHLVAQKKQVKVQYHLRIDTTGGSLGIEVGDVVAFLNKTKELSGLELSGIYTHLYSSYGQDDILVRQQISKFNNIVDDVKELMPQPIVVHAASTPGIVNWPETYYDMVRAGNILYGLAPEMDSDHYSKVIIRECIAVAKECKPVMQLKARIADVRKIAPGNLWVYGHQQLIDKETIIATVPLGYADGFPLAYIQNAQILIGGKKVAVLGKVVMDYFIVDVTELAGVAIGDEVVIWGEQAGETVTVDEIALHSRIRTVQGTSKVVETRISRASLCLLSTRLPRLYIGSEQTG
ncbi:MAG: alanine racemase [Firmicutes bacterium]|nr:alanine racemase [Bacillota bacterium]